MAINDLQETNNRTTELKPTLRVTIQGRGTRHTAGLDPDDYKGENALALTSEEGWIEGTVSAATTSEKPSITTDLQITNLPEETANLIDPTGFIKIEGGYRLLGKFEPVERSEVDKSLEPIFFGKISWAAPFVQGAETIWRIQATADSPRVKFTPVHEVYDNRTYGHIMENMVDRLGGSISMPGVLKGFGDIPKDELSPPKPFVAKEPVPNELERIMKRVNNIHSDRFQLTRLNSEAFAWQVIDKKERTSMEHIRYNVQNVDTFSAGLTPKSSSENEVEYGKLARKIEDLGDEEEARRLQTKLARGFRYRITTTFDPRYELGTWVDIQDERGIDAVINIDSVRHSIGGNRWRTTFGGDVRGSDELAGFIAGDLEKRAIQGVP